MDTHQLGPTLVKTFPSTYGDIYLGDVREGLNTIIEAFSPSSLIVVADTHTHHFCFPLLEGLPDTSVIIIEAGEPHKTIESCEKIWSSLLASGTDRSSLLLNLGGGMICDLGGFAAACYKRGIRFGHIPTSLLAMTDAAIGGKTGINHQDFKNLVGRFEFPVLTWVDPVFLKTLPEKEVLTGLAEVVKHAIIGSAELLDILMQTKSVAQLPWEEVIAHSIRVKQRVVESDPFEKGVRKTLNFGHTLGHAFESHFLLTDHPLSHGQAVTLGMMAELQIALALGILKNEEFERIIALIMRWLPPSEVNLPSLKTVAGWLEGDKKRSGGKVGFSLPDQIGSCQWDVHVEPHQIEHSLNWLAAHLRDV